MLKKMGMLFGLVLVLAVPATASAQWTDNTIAVQEPQQIGFTGTNLKFNGKLGGVECQTTSKVQFTKGTTGHVESFVPHPGQATENCKGTGGLGPCQVHDVTALATPWTLHTNTTNISITTGTITSTQTGGIFCLVKHVALSPGTVTATVDDPHKVSTAQLSGSLTAQLETNGGAKHQETVNVEGLLHVEAPNAGTYGIT